MKYNETYMMTAFIIHSKKNVLTSALKKMGGWALRERCRELAGSTYTFHTRLNCNLDSTNFKGKPFYTEADLRPGKDSLIPTVALNSVMLRTVTGKMVGESSPFALMLMGKKSLKDHLIAVSREEVHPSLAEYMQEINKRSDGIIQICIRIESITDYIRDAFKEGITHIIELPGIEVKRFPLQQAITLALSRDLDELPASYKPYVEKYRNLGFINPKEVLEGIFDQQLYILEQDDCLPNMILTLGELAYLRKLFVEDVWEALSYCRDKYNILVDLKDAELRPLAEYFVELCYETIKPKEEE